MAPQYAWHQTDGQDGLHWGLSLQSERSAAWQRADPIGPPHHEGPTWLLMVPMGLGELCREVQEFGFGLLWTGRVWQEVVSD